jgi:hypothetical protein
MPYLSVTHANASSLDASNDNAGAANTVVIELGDTVIRSDQFQDAISALEAYVVKCAGTTNNFNKAFTEGSGGDGTATISGRLKTYFTNDADASGLSVVDNKSNTAVSGGVAAVISNTVDMPMNQIDQARLNTAWADWIIPTLFEGSYYGVVTGEKGTAPTNTSGAVSSDTSGSGNIGGADNTFITKDKFIKMQLQRMGIFDSLNKLQSTGTLSGKKVIFLARLVAGSASSQGGGPNTNQPIGSKDYNNGDQNKMSPSATSTQNTTRIALEFKTSDASA